MVVKIKGGNSMPNPVFSQNAIERETILDSEPMTINGALNKTFILLGLL